MPTTSRTFDFLKLGPGDQLSTNNYEFTQGNIDKIDALLLYLANHTHDGSPPPQEGPENLPALDLTPATSGVGFDSETTIYYRYSLVAPDGTEGVASDAVSVTTPEPIPTPAAPLVAWGSASGSLPPGNYFYSVSAWIGSTTLETPASAPASVQIPSSATTARAVLTLPELDEAAEGWNVYRRSPGAIDYQLVAIIELDDGPEWTDDGVTPIGLRFAPTYDTSQNATNVVVTVDEVDSGWSWRLYRSVVDGQWDSTLLDTIDGSETEFTDTGLAAFAGSPLEAEIYYPPIQPLSGSTVDTTGADAGDVLTVDDPGLPPVWAPPVGGPGGEPDTSGSSAGEVWTSTGDGDPAEWAAPSGGGAPSTSGASTGQVLTVADPGDPPVWANIGVEWDDDGAYLLVHRTVGGSSATPAPLAGAFYVGPAIPVVAAGPAPVMIGTIPEDFRPGDRVQTTATWLDNTPGVGFLAVIIDHDGSLLGTAGGMWVMDTTGTLTDTDDVNINLGSVKWWVA